jgi:leucyl-tRNA synthetase
MFLPNALRDIFKIASDSVSRAEAPSSSPIAGGGPETELPQRIRGFYFTLEQGKRLRKAETPAEKKLWQIVRNKGLGVKFRRQHGIGPFIVDFYCDAHRLVVELDGAVHDSLEARDYDREREKYLRDLGYRILRFRNEEILSNIERVRGRISDQCKLSPSYGGVGGGI